MALEIQVMNSTKRPKLNTLVAQYVEIPLGMSACLAGAARVDSKGKKLLV